jgi:hypothetical protein
MATPATFTALVSCHAGAEHYSVLQGDKTNFILLTNDHVQKRSALVHIDRDLALSLVETLCTQGAEPFLQEVRQHLVDAGEAIEHNQHGFIPGSMPHAYGAP